MPSLTPNSRTWTLRLKHHRTTILLHADPIQKLSSLRAELLHALRQANPSGTLNGHAIPQSADDIILARPVDINNLSQGWERLETKPPFGDDEMDGDGKGKGKGKVIASTPGAGKGKASVSAAGGGKMTDCPQGAGLRDGGVVAFRFRSEDEASARESGEDDEFVVVEQGGAEKWDVVVPTIEETYAEEDAALVREG